MHSTANAAPPPWCVHHMLTKTHPVLDLALIVRSLDVLGDDGSLARRGCVEVGWRWRWVRGCGRACCAGRRAQGWGFGRRRNYPRAGEQRRYIDTIPLRMATGTSMGMMRRTSAAPVDIPACPTRTNATSRHPRMRPTRPSSCRYSKEKGV